VFERKSRGLAARLASLLGIGRRDEEFFEGLEDALIEADLGAQAAMDVVDRLRRDGGAGPDELRARVKEMLGADLKQTVPLPQGPPPGVLLVLGVNGVGKTTTVAKLAAWYRRAQGIEDVVLCAADTFRAAAIDQLRLLGERLGLRVVSQQPGSDPGAVIYDAITSARSRSTPLVLVDTAGRMHSKADLVRELAKIDRVVRSRLGEGWYHKALVIDATTGQNALQQAEVFHQAIGLDSVIVAKSDSTAKGGIVVAIGRALGLPFSFVGVGEGMEDLEPFDADRYLDAMLRTE
jgi:fused signal recognition particle receptor